MPAPRFPYATKERIATPREPLNGLMGVNLTTPEQLTQPNELSGGQNVYTDMSGAVYNRNGAVLLGGIASAKGSQGGWVFRDNNQRYAVVAVLGGIIHWFNGLSLVPLAGAPTMSATLPVSGVFYPNTNKFYLTDGISPVVVLDQSGGSLAAVADNTITKSTYLGYHDNHLIFVGLPGNPGQFGVSDLGATTMNAASVTPTQGFLLGIANLDLYSSIVVTDQRAYRLSGITTTYDATGNLVYGPGSFLDLGPSRCLAPRSIINVKGAVYWLGLDNFNAVEVYRCDGQSVGPLGWEKIKLYLRNINTAALPNACGTPYGVYARFAVAPLGSAYNTQELLLDTARSVSYTESGNFGPPAIIWEPNHLPGFPVAQYATWTSSGQDYILAFDQNIGCIHRQGVGYYDDLPAVSSIPAPGSSPATGSIVVTPTASLSQPFTLTQATTALSCTFQTSLFSAGSGTVTFSIQTDNAGIPSGTVVGTAVNVTVASATLPAMVAGAFTGVSLNANQLYHLVVAVAGGNLTVTKVTTQTLTSAYLTGLGGSWSAGSGSPIMALTVATDIDSYYIQTTALDTPQYKKKMLRSLINGRSQLGANMTLAIGLQGRDSVFTDTPFSLGGNSAMWAPSSGQVPANSLRWAAPADMATATNQWVSSNPDFELPVHAPWFNQPGHYLSYRVRHVGQADWRINSLIPVYAIMPSTLE